MTVFADSIRKQHLSFVTQLRKQNHIENFEIQIVGENKRRITVSINASLKEMEEEELILGSLCDITEKKNLEASLVQSQKLDSIGRMAGGIAHDFNNLLTIINGHCHLAIDKHRNHQEGLEHDLDAISTAGDKAAGLTRQMLAFSRKQVYTPQTINPNLSIIELERMFRRMISEDIDIQLNLDKSMGTYIKADPSQLEQIAINLLINARDAIKAKKEHILAKRITIETSTQNISKSEADELSETAPGDYFVLSVSDSGIGMTEEIRHNIFESFYTTKDHGTGLGLSIIYSEQR